MAGNKRDAMIRARRVQGLAVCLTEVLSVLIYLGRQYEGRKTYGYKEKKYP